MAKRQKQWAARATLALKCALGFECAHCHASAFAGIPLEFDCIIPQGHAHHRLDYSARLSFYRAQHRASNLQLLCPSCHEAKSNRENPRRTIRGLICPQCLKPFNDDDGSLRGQLCPSCFPP